MNKNEFLIKLLSEHNDVNHDEFVKISKTYDLLHRAGKFSAMYWRRREDRDDVITVVITPKLYSRNGKVAREDNIYQPMKPIDVKIIEKLVEKIDSENPEGIHQLPVASTLEHDGKKYYIIGASIMFGRETDLSGKDDCDLDIGGV